MRTSLRATKDLKVWTKAKHFSFFLLGQLSFAQGGEKNGLSQEPEHRTRFSYRFPIISGSHLCQQQRGGTRKITFDDDLAKKLELVSLTSFFFLALPTSPPAFPLRAFLGKQTQCSVLITQSTADFSLLFSNARIFPVKLTSGYLQVN